MTHSENLSSGTEALAQEFSALLDTLTDGVLVIDAQGRVETFNAAAEALFGYNPEEITGQNVSVLMPAEIGSKHDQYLERYLETGNAKIIGVGRDVTGRRKDGSTFPLQLRVGEVDVDGRKKFVGTVSDLTSTREAASALAKSEASLKALTELSPVALFRSNFAGSVDFLSDTFTKITGLDGKSVTGARWGESIHADDRDKVVADWLAAVEDAGDFSGEYRITLPDGEVRWVFGQATPEYDRGGKCVGYVGTITDLSAAKEIEAALRASEANLKVITELSPGGVFRADKQGVVTFVNERWLEIFGLHQDDDPADWMDNLHPDDRSEVSNIWLRAVASQAPYSGEFRIVRPDGPVIWIHAEARPEQDQHGKVMSYVGTSVDITALKESEQSLRQSEQELRDITSFSPVALVRTNREGSVTFVNEAFLEIHERDREEMLGDSWADAIHPDDLGRIEEQWRHSAETGDGFNEEYRVVQPDGRVVWVFGQTAPLRDEKGEIFGHIGTLTVITDRKAAEAVAAEERRRTEEAQRLLRDAVESFTEGFALFDAEDRFVLCNNAYRNNYRSVDDYLRPGVPFEDYLRAIYGAEELIAAKFNNEDVIQDRLAVHRNPETGPWQVETAEGRWLLVHEYPTRQGGTALIRSDITERKLAERKLQESEERFRDYTNATSDWFWEVGADGVIKFISSGFKAFSGRDPGDFVGKKFTEAAKTFQVEAEPSNWGDFVDRTSRQEPFPDLIFSFVNAGGEKRFLRCDGIPVFDQDAGKLVGYRGTSKDITNQKHLEQELQESEERWKLAFEGTRDGLWEWKPQSNETNVSKRWKAILGYGDEAVINGIEEWTERIHPDDKDRVLAETEKHMSGEVPFFHSEHRLQCKDGSYKWILNRGMVFERNENGDALRALGTYSDISERKEVEAELLEAQAQAETANRAKSDFLSSMSHELRTPMNAVLGFAQLLEHDAGGPLEEQQRNFVDEILRSGHHMMELIDDVLDLARVESGNIPMVIEPVAPRPLIDSCLSMVEAAAIEGNLSLDARFPEQGLPLISVDAVRFKQVLLNLLSNALKYNRSGGSVVLECELDADGSLRISISDTGLGIPDEKHGQVFDPFDRLGFEESNVAGTGIGLTVTKRIIESMGGEIGFTSAVDEGSTFWVTVPLVAAEQGVISTSS